MFFGNNVSSWPDYSIVYSIPYLLLGLFVFVLGYKEIWNENIKTRKWKYVLLFFIFLAFFGLRWHILSDTLAYESEFYSIRPDFSWDYIDDHSDWWDKGFVIFAMMVKLIYNDFFFFVFINSFIDILLFTLCLKKYCINVFLALLSFLAFQGILTEINLMRNIKAILLFIYSISYIRDKKLVKFLLINLLGYTFHSSALLFIPMYWVLNRRYSIKVVYIVMAAFTVIYMARFNVLEDYLMAMSFQFDSHIAERIEYYLNSQPEPVFSVGFMERLISLALILGIYQKVGKEDRFNLIMANSFFVFYILYSVFGFNTVFRDRIPFLFVYCYWFLYPYLFKQYTKGKNKQMIGTLFLVLFFGKIFLATHMKSYYYESVLTHETTRNDRSKLLEFHD